MKRAELLSVIMHDIGLPVIQGIIDVAVNKSDEKITEDVTELLRKTVDNADEIKSLLNLLEDEEDDVSVRLNLATLSCHIIAAHYQKNRKLPSEAELKRSVASIDILLTFSEKYIPMDRLDGVFPEHLRGLSPLSRTVANLVYLKFYIPLIDVISEFSFGQAETKMIQDVSEKLRSKAEALTTILMGEDISEPQRKSSELLILSSLIPLYSACHDKERKRVLTLSESERNDENNEQQIHNIWKMFEKRLEMLTILSKHIMPDHFTDEDISAIENLFTDNTGFVALDEEQEVDAFKQMSTDSDDEAKDKKTFHSKKGNAKKKSKKTSSAKKKKDGSPLAFYNEDEDE